MARIFSAIDIEDEQVLQKLETIRDALDLGFKPVESDKMHITLEFFEDIDEDEIEKVKQAIEKTDIDPFEAKIGEIGAFPSEDYIRVIWAGLEHPRIYELQEKIAQHPIISDNEHEFKPHITLLRVENISQKDKKKVQKTMDEYRDTVIGKIKLDKIKLFKSDLTPNGAEYTKLMEKKL